MATKKQKAPEPNYLIEIVEVGKKGVCLIDAKEFYSPKKIKEITYWKKNRCFTVQKFDPDEAKIAGKRKSRGSKRTSSNSGEGTSNS